MLHDVTITTFHPEAGSRVHVVQVDATGGDDAAAQGAVEAVAIANGGSWKIVGVAPSGAVDAPAASVEGDDVMVPDELEPAKRGPGRPRRDATAA